jgi:hypothetical protein
MIKRDDYMVLVICPRCGHGKEPDKQWDFKGTQPVTRCPKCGKHVNIAKARFMMEQGQGQPMQQVSMGRVPELPSSDKIIVEEVKVAVPEQLREIPAEEKKPAEAGKAAVRQVEIPYKTISILCEAPFNLWATMEKDEEFKLKEMDKETLVPLVQQYLNAHMGAWMGQYSNEIAIGIVLGLIIMTRIAIKAKKGTLKILGGKPEPANSNTLPESSKENRPAWMEEKR